MSAAPKPRQLPCMHGARCGRQTVRASGSASGAKGAAGGALLEENEGHDSAWLGGSTDERNLWIWTCGRTCQQPATRRVCDASGAGNACAGCGDSPRSMHTVSLVATGTLSASPLFCASPSCRDDLRQLAGRTERAIWRARRERQGVAGRQATQAARRLRVVGMTTPRLAERNRIERTPGGVHINTEEHCRTVSSPTRNHQAHTDPSELNPLFPYVFSPTPGGDVS